MQPRRSAPKERDNVTATCDCGQVMAILYRRLATRLTSLAILLPIHLYTITRVHVSNRIHIITRRIHTRPNTGVPALTLDCESVRLADSAGHPIYSEMNAGAWWWYMHDHLPAGVTIVPVMCASDKAQWIKVSGDQHAWLLYVVIGNICTDIHRTAIKLRSILVEPICGPPKDANNTDEVWHSTVGTELTQLLNFDVTGPGLWLNFADGFHRQSYPLLAAWVRDYPEQVIIAQVSYLSCLMCAISKGAPMGYSTFWWFNNWWD